jgi:hypothetical protein
MRTSDEDVVLLAAELRRKLGVYTNTDLVKRAKELGILSEA